MNNLFYVLAFALPMLLGAALLLFKKVKIKPFVLVSSAVFAIFTALAVFCGGDGITLLRSGGLTLTLRSDEVSRFFALLVTTAFVCASVFALEYTEKDEHRQRLFGFTFISLGAMLGLCFSSSLFSYYLFFEILSLCSYPMVLHNNTPAARAAALKYLGFSVAGAALALAGLMLCPSALLAEFSASGAGIVSSPAALASALLIALGFSSKAGLYPLCAWLPTAHPEAPAPASALLSGVITKAGILGMLRTMYYVFGAPLLKGSYVQTVLCVLAIATIFIGSMLAYEEKLLKKRLAYSSVSQLSYVVFALCMFTPSAFTGALEQVLFHSLAKVGLFLCAGAIIHKTGHTLVRELRGIGREMPVVMCCFTLFSLSLIGIPPLGGFAAKWAIASGSLGSTLGDIGVVVLLISALLTAGYTLPIVADAFFPGEDYSVKKREPSLYMTLPLCALALLSLALGAFPAPLTKAFSALSDLLCGGAL